MYLNVLTEKHMMKLSSRSSQHSRKMRTPRKLRMLQYFKVQKRPIKFFTENSQKPRVLLNTCTRGLKLTQFS